jgi:hypothetical protein
MKTQLIALAGAFILGLAVSSCNEKKGDNINRNEIVEVRVDFESERNEMRQEIRELEVEIDKEIARLEEK